MQRFIFTFISLLLATMAQGQIFTGKSVKFYTNKNNLEDSSHFYFEKKPDVTEWGNFDDQSGKEGNPCWPAEKFAWLNLPLGFGFIETPEGLLPVAPTFKTLKKNLKRLKLDVGFFEVDGECPPELFLKQYVEGLIPIAKPAQNPRFFLHDMNYHVLGHILTPVPIRKLMQRQTCYLLDFIEQLKKSERIKRYENQIFELIDFLIRKQAENIDMLANLHSMLTEKNFDFSNLDETQKNLCHHKLMQGTMWSYRHPSNSARLFFLSIFEDYQEKFLYGPEDKKACLEIFIEELDSYIGSKKNDPEFNELMEVEEFTTFINEFWASLFGFDSAFSKYIRENKLTNKFGKTSIDLFTERLTYLSSLHKNLSQK